MSIMGIITILGSAVIAFVVIVGVVSVFKHNRDK